jgi:trans-aconitate methyltransferase
MIKRLIVAFLKRYGPTGIKGAIWNEELATFVDPPNIDPVTPLIEKYAAGGRILDLGCGTGFLGEYLDANKYSAYLGVDISDSTVEGAIKRRASSKLRFAVSDIATYAPEQTFNVIVFNDSIYYIPFSKIRKVLNRYRTHLADGGVFVVRIADGKRFAKIIEEIRNNFTVVESFSPGGTNIVLMAFK